jgi:hypothetical protein
VQPQVERSGPIPVRRRLTEQLGHVIEAGGVPRDRVLPSVSGSRPAFCATRDGRVGGGGPLGPPGHLPEIGPLVCATGSSTHERNGMSSRAFQVPSRMERSCHAGRGIHGHAQFDVPHLLRPDGPGRLPHPRTRRDGAPEVSGSSPFGQSVAWRPWTGALPELRPGVRERVDGPADLPGVSVEAWGLRQRTPNRAGLGRPPGRPGRGLGDQSTSAMSVRAADRGRGREGAEGLRTPRCQPGGSPP